MSNLSVTVENIPLQEFWDKIKQEFPKAFEIFGKWIDDYKGQVNWEFLFNASPKSMTKLSSPKFHDLPVALQRGIFETFQKDYCNFLNRDSWYIELEEYVGFINYETQVSEFMDAIENF